LFAEVVSPTAVDRSLRGRHPGRPGQRYRGRDIERGLRRRLYP